MYDPSIGRWLTPDPKGFDAGDDNLYRYVRNDPTNAIDPAGEEANPVEAQAKKQPGFYDTLYARADRRTREIVRLKFNAQGVPGGNPDDAEIAKLQKERQEILKLTTRFLNPPQQQLSPPGFGGLGTPMSRGAVIPTGSLRPGSSAGMTGMGFGFSIPPKYPHPSEQEYMKQMATYAAKALPIFQRALQAYMKQVLAKPPAELARALMHPLPVNHFAGTVIKELGNPPISSNKEQALQDVLIAVQAEAMRQEHRRAAAAAERERQIARAIASMPKQEIIPEPGTTLYDDWMRRLAQERRERMRRAGVSEWYIWGEFFLPGGSFDQMMETLAPLAGLVETRNNIQATVEGNRPMPPVAADVRPVAGAGGGGAGARPGLGGFGRSLSTGAAPTVGEVLLARLALEASSPSQAQKIAELINRLQSTTAAADAKWPAEAHLNLNVPKQGELFPDAVQQPQVAGAAKTRARLQPSPTKGATTDFNNVKGTVFENLVENRANSQGARPFFRARRRGGIDLATLEGRKVVLNEEKFANQLQFDDFTAITTNLRENIKEILQSLPSNSRLTREEKSLIKSTLEQFLANGGGTPDNLMIRVITGKVGVGRRLQKRLRGNTQGLPIEFVDFTDLEFNK